MLNNKSILVTGGTGSFGKVFIRLALENYNPKKIIVYSRDEMKQWNMNQDYSVLDPSNKIQYVIGDVRDKDQLYRAMDDVDILIHAAATKIVPTAEYNPYECIKTNVLGAMNIIEASIDSNVKKIIALSTDKACNPINLYGASKLASDKLFIAANLNTVNSKTSFSIVRYGNVIGSRGSVIPYFQKFQDNKLPITDIRMTRFMITIDQAVNMVWHAIEDSLGGEIYIHKIPSMKIVDIAQAINPLAKFDIIGIRPGEKINEIMIGEEDSLNTYEYDWYYKILPTINSWNEDKKRIKNGKKANNNFIYSSDKNNEWMSIKDLQDYISSDSYKKLKEMNI